MTREVCLPAAEAFAFSCPAFLLGPYTFLLTNYFSTHGELLYYFPSHDRTPSFSHVMWKYHTISQVMEYYHTFSHSMGDGYTVSNPDCSKIP